MPRPPTIPLQADLAYGPVVSRRFDRNVDAAEVYDWEARKRLLNTSRFLFGVESHEELAQNNVTDHNVARGDQLTELGDLVGTASPCVVD